ncbi:hypothetical protein DAPPUDRAFT_254643 [Daphnia pulex]|uniref:Uncharacterized protein n=1 Tax=Daphnia pulex TaxID=6669 RepID=E9H7I7_DAPPU|nr:hypothetical protein DAPPUDRAFT_254643 [Daphnia pulex]|eukprot:EFX72304.1 hypothetical protein DAPPUDRAFT_254643 [Daphnia pulex]
MGELINFALRARKKEFHMASIGGMLFSKRSEVIAERYVVNFYKKHFPSYSDL